MAQTEFGETVKFKLAGDQLGAILGVGVLDYLRSLRWLQFIEKLSGGVQFCAERPAAETKGESLVAAQRGFYRGGTSGDHRICVARLAATW